MSDPRSKPRAVFFGTPAFAVPSLRALGEIAEVALVVTQPDRPAGRGMRVVASPIKEAALVAGLPVLQPHKVRTPELAERLRAEGADVSLVVAYGRILPPAVLAAARLGCINVHASLLPELRGAAPIQWALVRGHARTGVCLMQMDEGMDTGPVLACRAVEIGPDETAGELSLRLAELGADLVRESLPRYLAGELVATPQDDASATLAPMLRKEHGRIDWTRSAHEVHDLVRGMQPWPGAHAFHGDERVKVLATRVLDAEGSRGAPGALVPGDGDALAIACGRGVVAVEEIQPAGGRPMKGVVYRVGRRLETGARFD